MTKVIALNIGMFRDGASVGRTLVARESDFVFVQGDRADSVAYIEAGAVKLSVVSTSGQEAIVAMLGPGDFFGEGCLAGQSRRTESATAIMDSTIRLVDKDQMARLLHGQPALLDRFISHVLTRKHRIEEDFVDQIFNRSERRLARTLLLLNQHAETDTPQKVVPKISQQTLADMVGTTRSRVNKFMTKFKRLGYVNYNGYKDGLTINNSLLTSVLQDNCGRSAGLGG